MLIRFPTERRYHEKASPGSSGEDMLVRWHPVKCFKATYISTFVFWHISCSKRKGGVKLEKVLQAY